MSPPKIRLVIRCSLFAALGILVFTRERFETADYLLEAILILAIGLWYLRLIGEDLLEQNLAGRLKSRPDRPRSFVSLGQLYEEDALYRWTVLIYASAAVVSGLVRKFFDGPGFLTALGFEQFYLLLTPLVTILIWRSFRMERSLFEAGRDVSPG